MKDIKRVSAGVMFESDVLAFIDHLAATQPRNRSFIVNSLIRYYARMTQTSAALHESGVILPLIPQPLEPTPLIRF